MNLHPRLPISFPVTTSGVEGACSGSRHPDKMNLLHTVNLALFLNGRLDCRVNPVQLWTKEHCCGTAKPPQNQMYLLCTGCL